MSFECAVLDTYVCEYLGGMGHHIRLRTNIPFCMRFIL